MESDIKLTENTGGKPYFYPRSPHGERQLLSVILFCITPFLSTLSAWRATVCAKRLCAFFQISIHALRMESDDYSNFISYRPRGISIHALRMESDIIIFICQDGRYDISIHALRMESDFPTCTPPFLAKHFYPRSPHGERRRVFCTAKNLSLISIHALRMESDHAL